jgi:subtilase family serine protease
MTVVAAAAMVVAINGVAQSASPAAAPTSPTVAALAAPAAAPVEVASPVPVVQATTTVEPFTAAHLQDAYKLPSAQLGSRQTIAVVGAFDYPTAAADLAVYRAQNGLPPCDADFPCFRKVNQRGEAAPPPTGTSSWGLAAALTLQMASATCPNCRLLLVQADDDDWPNLGAAVDTAVRLGADVVATAYLDLEGGFALAEAVHYNHPGTVIVAAAGHEGFGNGIGRQVVPAAFPTVVAVGGTTLFRDDSQRGWGERVWSSTSSGCSAYLPKASWQRSGPCGDKRLVADVAAVGDPGTPVAVYDTHGFTGWLRVGGTGVAAGIVAGVYALAGNAATIDPGRQLSRSAYALYDITTGHNGACGDLTCTAGRGYDGPSGFGTPNGIGAF